MLCRMPDRLSRHSDKSLNNKIAYKVRLTAETSNYRIKLNELLYRQLDGQLRKTEKFSRHQDG